MSELNTPVLFLIFNRPETTERVFERIRAVKPSRLYVAADGPRNNKEGEHTVCKQTRELVIQNIDWDCEVKTLFREENLGCGRAVSEAISWFFKEVDEGIILEDDTLPNASFFSFCEELLKRYRNDEHVMHISGNNFQLGNSRGDGDYYYSKYSHIWGWATWKRAWQKYDYLMANWPEYKMRGLDRICYNDETQIEFWTKIFDDVYTGKIDTWDYQWLFSIWLNHAVCVLPNVNLVINIGFGENATHTKDAESSLAKMNSRELTSFNRPSLYNREADDFSFYNLFSPAPLQENKKNILTELLEKISLGLRK